MRNTIAPQLRTTVAIRLGGTEWQTICRAVTRDSFAVVERAMCGGPQLVIGRIHTCISQFTTKARRLPILVFVGWLLGLCVADGELRLIALDWPNPQGVLAMLHIGVSLPEQGTADISYGRTVCLSVNGSSRGCFDGDNNPNGALIPVNQAGIAWITGHFRAESGNALTTRPLAIDIPPSFAPIPPAQAAEDGLVWSPGGDAQPIQRSASHSGKISAVLLVTLKDVDLALLLLATLRTRGAMTLFGDFFVVVPSAELERIETILRQASFITAHDSKGVVLVDERRLLPRGGKVEPWWSKYALQMALKLLVSSLIRTEYYLTLDADILCSKAGLSEEDLLPQGKGNYVPEARQVHPTWWHASAKALGVEENPLGEGFGVTPAVLSTIGSMLTLQRLREVHGRDDFLDRMFNGFAQTPDKCWSEYTLYRTALDHFGAFDALHAVGPTKLIGDSVWYSEDFKTWNAAAAFNDFSAAFVVVQSTAGVGASVVRQLLSRLEVGLLTDASDPEMYSFGGDMKSEARKAS